MLLRALILTGSLISMQASAGWQAYQRYDFNTDSPWSYRPDAAYVGFLNSKVTWDQVSLMSPYAMFGFAFGSQCHSTWRAAWSEITHDHCQWNTWGPVEKKCSRDLFVVLPCESELLGMTPEQLKQQTKSFEYFLLSENERKDIQRANNIYATAAFEKAAQIYAAYHEKISLDKVSNYKAQVRDKVAANFYEELKELDARRRMAAAYDKLSTEFAGYISANQSVVEKWNALSGEGLRDENANLKQFNSELSAILSSPALTWEAFRANQKYLIESQKRLDGMLIRWDDFSGNVKSFESGLSRMIGSFRRTHIDDFWSTAEGDATRDSLLTPYYGYLQKVQRMTDTAAKRSQELRDYRKNFVTMLQLFQEKMIERIALNEKTLYIESRKNLELASTFSDLVLGITRKVHLKMEKSPKLGLPFLYRRYTDLKLVVGQEFQCQGSLEVWKVDACEIARDNVVSAKKEIESIRSRYLRLYSKNLLKKSEEFKVDGSVLNRFIEAEPTGNLEDSLKIYDSMLTLTESAAAQAGGPQ